MTIDNEKPFQIVGVDTDDGSATVLFEFDSSGEARSCMRRYVSRENAGNWDRIEVLDTRSECAETLWTWERDEE